VINILS